MKNIGYALLILRRSKGMTLNELSEKVNLSQSFLSQVENSKRIITMAQLSDYAKFFKVSLSEILHFEESLKNTSKHEENMTLWFQIKSNSKRKNA
jgi:transcriptional regulator with XRE-family HTH domain